MRRTTCGALVLGVLTALLASEPAPVRANSSASIPGFMCETYATLPFPVALSFDAAGNLFAGNEEVPQGKAAVKIRKIPPGGGSFADFGTNELPDPDGVLVDDDGSISGTPGAVLVCGHDGVVGGQILAELPDESIITVSAASAVMENPNYMARGRDGLLISDSGHKAVYELVPPAAPVVLIPGPAVTSHIAVDAAKRIFVAYDDGTIRVYDPDGAVLDEAFATGLGNQPPFAISHGGPFGTDLVAIHQETGELVRIASDKTATVIGTGLPSSVGSMTFGPDDALYVASFQSGEILRVSPAPPPPITSFFLPKKVVAKVNATSAAKSTVTAGGIFDTGPDAPDFASAATLDVGGLHFDIPGLTAAGKSFAFSGNGVTFSIAPNPYGSSRAKFKLKFTGDFAGKVALNGPLDLFFDNAITDGGGTVTLGSGVFGLGKVKGALVQPNLFVVRARANLKGAGKDALSVIVGLATGGATPPAAAELKIGFGAGLSATIPAGMFVRKGATDTFTGNVNGVTKVVFDYAREQIAITGKALTLGNFAQGGNPVLLSVGVGNDVRSVNVRMGRIGNTMKY